MGSEIQYRIAQKQDLDLIYYFAEVRLKEGLSDDAELMIAVWNSRFRKEALEHYLGMGWSFLAEDRQGQLRGFFLGQPLLFFQGHTQSLWIELVEASDETVFSDLVEIAYKLARDKHLQQVLFPEQIHQRMLRKSVPLMPPKESFVWAKTTK